LFLFVIAVADARYPIFPTRMALTVMKTRLKGAITGHSLLKKKSDALTVRFRAILKQITDVRVNAFFFFFFFFFFFRFVEVLTLPALAKFSGQEIDGRTDA
jgi:hypothetical protein